MRASPGQRNGLQARAEAVPNRHKPGFVVPVRDPQLRFERALYAACADIRPTYMMLGLCASAPVGRDDDGQTIRHAGQA